MPRDPIDISTHGPAKRARQIAALEDQKDPIRLRTGSGPAGATGPEGPKGEKGATGAEGPQGKEGPAGPPALTAEIKRSSANLTLEVAAADVAGCTFTTPVEGAWRIVGHFDFICEEGGSAAVGICSIAGVEQEWQAIFSGTAANQRLTASQEWQSGVIAKGTVIKLRAKRTGNKYKALAPHSSLSVLRVT